MEQSEESSNVIMTDEKKKSNANIKESLSERRPQTKLTWKEYSQEYNLNSPNYFGKINTSSNYLNKSFYESINDKKKVNVFDEYKVIQMNEEDQRLMICYDFIKNNKEFKINDIRIFDCLNKIISLILIQRKPITIIIVDDNGYEIHDNAREIIFVNQQLKQIIKKFIYSTDNLTSVLKNLGFISYYVKSSNDKIDKNNNIINSIKEKESDSESSEVSLDPYKIFFDNTIKYIYNENQKPILNEKNFNKKFSPFLFKLKNLNFNAKYYYKCPDNCFCMFNKDYDKAIKNFIHFRDSYVSKIVYLFGPKRCSKTTLLLYMINDYQYTNSKFLYFNYDYLEKKDIIHKKRIIYHELLYFCKDIEEMKKIEQKKIFNNISDKTNMEFIYLILESLFNVIKDNIDETKRIIIIDNVYTNDKEALKYLNNIISLIQGNNWYIKLILSGRGPYFNQKFYNCFKAYHVFTNDDDLERIEMPEFLYIYYTNHAQIYAQMDENLKKENENIDESNLKKEMENKIYSFYELFFSEELDKKTFTHKEIEDGEDCFIKFPLEYFIIKIKKEKEVHYISFNFYNTSFKKTFRNIIGFEIEKGTLTKLLERDDYPRTFLGICFEKLVTLLLMHNKLNLHNLKFNKNNIKEINKISKLKEDNYDGPIFNDVNVDEPILLIQEDFFGPLYDLLIITKRNKNYYSDFVQIGVDKTSNQINEINEAIKLKYKIYQNNIFKAFGINSEFISALFIFDYETQKNRDYSTGYEKCIRNNINFYLFSSMDCSLVKLNSNKEKIKVREYSPSSIININNYEENYSNSKNDKKKKNKGNKGTKSTSNNTKITDFFEHNEN